MRLPAATRPPTIVASARQLGGLSTKRPSAGPIKQREDWSGDAWWHYDSTGIVWYASQFYAKLLSRITLYVATGDPASPQRIPDPQDPPPGETISADDGMAFAALSQVRDANGGRSSLQYRYGQLMFVVGDARLVLLRRLAKTGRVVETWEMLSRDELSKRHNDTDIYVRKPGGGEPDEEYTDLAEQPNAKPTEDRGTALVYRFWRPHPRRSGEADAPLRAAIGDVDELALLSRAVRSRARIRSTGAGLLFLPQDMRAPSSEPSDDPQDPDKDPVTSRIIEAIFAAVSDEQADTAAVPIVLRAPGDIIGQVRHLTLDGGSGEKYPEASLRPETIDRIATNLDMPKEWLTGAGDLNHWNLWGVRQETWDSHGEPVARMLAGDWTSAYLRPTLEANGMAPELAATYFIAVDASAVVIPADRTNDAAQLHDRGAISDEAYRDAAGFPDGAAPSPDTPNSNPALIALFRAPFTGPGQEAPQPTGPFQQPAPATTPGADGTTQDGQGDVQPGPPAGARSAALEQRLLGACDAAVWQARRTAGQRLRTKASAKTTPPEVRQMVLDVPNIAQIAAVLGEQRVQAALNGSGPLRAGQLVQDADGALAAVLGGIEAPSVPGAQLRAEVLEHAAATLYSLDPGPQPDRVCSLVRLIAREASGA